MTAIPYVCKHCGSDKIGAEVEARDEASGHVEKQGDHLLFVEKRRPWFDDYDTLDYHCEDCGEAAGKLSDLVKIKEAEDELRNPCGRCDHGALAHPLPWHSRSKYPEYFTRPAMPCTVEGCDCHDYYDLAIANAGLAVETAGAVERHA